jgi:hypothetical protein
MTAPYNPAQLAAQVRQGQGVQVKASGPSLSTQQPQIDVLAMLKSGQMSAASLIQFLSMMAGMGPQGMQGPQAGQTSPIEEAMSAEPQAEA